MFEQLLTSKFIFIFFLFIKNSNFYKQMQIFWTSLIGREKNQNALDAANIQL